MVGFQLRAGLFFGLPSSFCVMGLPGISPIYRFRFLVLYALAYLSKKKKTKSQILKRGKHGVF